MKRYNEWGTLFSALTWIMQFKEKLRYWQPELLRVHKSLYNNLKYTHSVLENPKEQLCKMRPRGEKSQLQIKYEFTVLWQGKKGHNWSLCPDARHAIGGNSSPL